MGKTKSKPSGDWLSQMEPTACPDCSRECIEVTNINTGKTGLLQRGASVLAVFQPTKKLAREEFALANTVSDFLARVNRFSLVTGGEIRAADVRFLPAHKFCCVKRPPGTVKLIAPGVVNDWAESLIYGACNKPRCSTPLLWARNTATNNPVPLDARSPIYAVRVPTLMEPYKAVLSTDFLKDVHRIHLHSGEDISPAMVRFFVSHFSTCTDPDAFRKHYPGGKR